MIIDKSNKFKTTIISVRFKEKITKENVGLRALLPNLMSASTNVYKTRQALSEALEDLYGASINVRTTKTGLISIMEFSIYFINQSFTEEPIFEEALEILHEVVYGHKNLPKKEFELEKRLLLEKIASFDNDKTSFALSNLFETMFENEQYGIRTSGKIEDVKPITYDILNRYYKEMLKTNDIDVVISGQVDESLLKLVSKYFIPRNNLALNPIDYEDKQIEMIKNKVDYDTISQSKVNIGYRLPIRYKETLLPAATLFNTALGGAVHSRLFVNVREKHSLCYYIGSRFDAFKGFMYIYSGIDKSRFDLALKVIDEQIEDLQNKPLSETELNLSKESIINALIENQDSQSASLANLYLQTLLNNPLTLAEQIDKIRAVTPKEVQAIAKTIKKDTLYILAPEVK
ncbi:MAG: pitrilysin family protein [Acholeplasmataceae bacterium]|nr:pitrilysin family protein [Acholeplasmataceae bacterium]